MAKLPVDLSGVFREVANGPVTQEGARLGGRGHPRRMVYEIVHSVVHAGLRDPTMAVRAALFRDCWGGSHARE